MLPVTSAGRRVRRRWRALPRMDFLGQPAGPVCGTIMADIPNGYRCRECNTAWSPSVHMEPWELRGELAGLNPRHAGCNPVR